ncbi:MAG: AsmA-like C-terminal region-containing protein [Rickettsiales bacterium]|nr:AsmA-like C-terminal region-containing protein [Rickettsiales bacterium]
MSIFRTQFFANFISSLARLRYKLSLGYSFVNKIFLIGLVLVGLGWYNFDNLASLIITENSIKNGFAKSINETFGKNSAINGEIKFVTKPQPYLTIKNIEVESNIKSYHKNFVEIQEFSTKPNLLSLLVGRINYDEIFLKNVKIYINSDKAKNQDLYQTLIKEFSAEKSYFNKKINFKNLEFFFIKEGSEANSREKIVRSVSFNELVLDPTNKEFVIKGLIHSEKFGEDYIFNVNFRDGLGQESDISAKVYSNDTEINFLGAINSSKNFNLKGNISGKISAFSFKFFGLLGFSSDILDAIQINEVAEIKAEIDGNNKSFNIKNFNAKSDILDLDFNCEISIAEKLNINSKIEILSLDWKNLFKSRKDQISIRKIEDFEKDFNKRLNKFFLFSLGDDINFTLDFLIDKINFFEDKTGFLKANISFIDKIFKVTNFDANLPGETILKFLADIKVDKPSRTMAGNIGFAIYGKKLDELSLATGIISNLKNSPDLGEFFMQAKGVLEGKKIHFREVISKINDNKFAGQILIDYSTSLQALAAFNFDRLELDRYIIQENAEENYQSSFSEKVDFLRFLDSVFDEFKISIKSSNITKSGENLRDFQLVANIKPGITELKKLYFKSFKYGEFVAFGNIDIKDFQPIIDASIRVQRLDYDYIKYDGLNAKNDFYNFDGKFEDRPISFADLGYVQGKVKLAIDKLKYEHFNLDSFRLNLDMKGNKVDILDSKFELYNSQFTFSGWLTTEYPSFAISFVTTNLDASQFLRNVFGINQIYGKFNVSATIASTGYNLKQLIKDAKGRAEIGTNGFKVTGFNLSGLASGIVQAKKIEDTKTIANEYLNSGETIFGGIQTSIGLNDGEILLNKIALEAKSSDAKGEANGSLDLLNWQNNFSSSFTLKSLDGITLNLVSNTRGKIGKAEISWNEDAFPKYWEERFYGR